VDKLTQYRHYVKELLQQYASYRPAFGEVEVETIFDSEHDHYQLVLVGWEGQQRVYGCIMHLDIKQSKVWIQQNSTEASLAQELVALGIPKEDIVLGLQLPTKRPFTGFAVA
jgi:XisI protein